MDETTRVGGATRSVLAAAVVVAGGLVLALALALRDGRGTSTEAPPAPAEPLVGRLVPDAQPLRPDPLGDPARTEHLSGAFSPGPGPGEADAGSEPLARDPGRPAGERDHYRAFLELAQRDPVALLTRAREELLGDQPDARKVALLRALHDTAHPGAGEHFELAIRRLPDRSSAHASSVPDFAVRHLGERAGEDPAARAVLRAVTFGPERATSKAIRRRAAMYLARTSTAAELHDLAPELRAERDELLRAGFASGLLANTEERTVELLYSDLLAAREALAGEPEQPAELD